MNASKIDYKSIYYPPGGILLWIIIFLELITFGIALIFFALNSKENPTLFAESRQLLNTTFGVVNTVFLLTSGFFMANVVSAVKKRKHKMAKKHLLLTMLFGVLFLVLKSVEYTHKIDAGLGMGYNVFFNYYWLLTLFHVIHVVVGLVILMFTYIGIKKETSLIEDVEASAAFWHMCDLIWLLLFPILYLLA